MEMSEEEESIMEDEEYKSLLGLVPKEMLDEAVESHALTELQVGEDLSLSRVIQIRHDQAHLEEMGIAADLRRIAKEQKD